MGLTALLVWYLGLWSKPIKDVVHVFSWDFVDTRTKGIGVSMTNTDIDLGNLARTVNEMMFMLDMITY